VLLTFAYKQSKPIITSNEKMDVVKNVLLSFDIDYSNLKTQEEISALFSERVEEKKIANQSYFVSTIDGKKMYCFPVIAKGLWGLIYGFISVQSDLKTTFRVTFNKHAETPGLGSLIDEPKYQNQYKGLKLYSAKESYGIVSIKSGGKKSQNTVDAITGATLTSEAVAKGINDSLKPYLESLGK
jgi:Na+-transporting NADH:ubiquinone oxidoreductase subunit C